MLLTMTPEMWWAAFGWLGSALVVFSLLQTNIVWLRVFNLIGCVLAVVYNTPLAIWPSVGLNAAITVINAVHLVRLRRERLRAEAAEQAESERAAERRTELDADPRDALVRSLLALRREEVERRGGEALPALLERAEGVVLVFDGDTLRGCSLRLPEGTRWVYGDGAQRSAAV